MLLVLRRAIKTNSIPPVTYLHRSTTSKQPLSMVHDRSLLPRSSRVLIKNISQKCSRDDRKMTLGGLHGHGMVHTSGVGAPMVPRGHVIHHQQRCRAQQQVIPTIARLIWRSSFESLMKVLRGRRVERQKRRWSVIYEKGRGASSLRACLAYWTSLWLVALVDVGFWPSG